MSSGNDNPFARWSRRKLAVRKAEAPVQDEARGVAEPADEREAAPGEPQPTPAEPDTEEPPEFLPRIEDLTAASDLTAFLRKGVPGALRNTALRKMWSLDPVIRNYVGPAEYAWDFNKPGSMPGFGPLEAGKAVADFLSKVGGSGPRDTAAEPEAAPPRDSAASPDQSAAGSPDEDAAASPQEAGLPPDRPADASTPPAVPVPPGAPAATPHASLSPSRPQETTAAPADKASAAESPSRPTLSRHGGALPR
jgi:hypothetical protein